GEVARSTAGTVNCGTTDRRGPLANSDYFVDLVLSTTTAPPFITQRTLLMVTLTSASGSPSTATMSAKNPGATPPICFSIDSIFAGTLVAAASACSGVMPA